MSIDELTPSVDRDKLKETQQLCEDGGEVNQASVVEKFELFWMLVETNFDSANLRDRTAGLEEESEHVCSIEWLERVSLEVASEWIKPSQLQPKIVDEKYAKMVDQTAQTEMSLRACIISLKSLLKADVDYFHKIVGDKDVFADQFEE